ncbi:O-antigen ligase [Afifella sp. IM 167]|uniref:O-antigen ligase family protein n=1 Tax=Afifella sp. IM 167 TaxID=2033586 RepID=UPI001CCDADB4|nr:O-antigen ligase family protein [Afifella sp. IM 167]MBZ8132509.1 hypothetical protein [Afifella sp. IM 167]
MHAAADRAGLYPTQVRNFVFFLAVIAMNYTLSRPSPVDFLFMSSLVLSVFVLQKVRLTFFIFFTLLVLWTVSFWVASIPFIGEPEVAQEGFKKTFVVVLAVTAGYVSMDWGPRQLHTFMRVYVLSCVIAACLGIVGFALGIEALLWDGRAKAFIDDPNMYASFLSPGVIMCLYMMNQRIGRTVLFGPALVIIALGILVSFSRAATVATFICASGYIVFLNRGQLMRVVAWGFAIALFAGVLMSAAFVSSPEFAKKFEQRATVAESYDEGREGRYGRYARSIPMILHNPIGIGILQQDKIFTEPIHNIFLSSFMNYGWVAGFSFLTLFILSLLLGIANYRTTRHPAAIAVLMCYLGPQMCASLHEGEHWRHFWLMLGILWGFNAANYRSAVPAPEPEPEPEARKPRPAVGPRLTLADLR